MTIMQQTMLQRLRHLSASIVFLTTLSAVSIHGQQGLGRVLLEMPREPERQSPVQIVSIKVEDQNIEVGHELHADEDWYRNLTFTLKNISDQPLSYVEIGLNIETPEGSRAKYASYSLRYGVNPFVQDRSAIPDRVKPVLPGESIELKMTENDKRGLTGLLANSGISPDVDRVKFDINMIGFERDVDVMWRHGFLMRRNASDPRRFDVAERYALTKKEGIE